MKSWGRVVAFWAVLGGFLLFPLRAAHGAAFGELKELYVDYFNFGYLNKDERNPVIYPSAPSTGLNLGETMDLFWGFGYLDAEVQSLTDSAQFREVGLQYRLGARPCKLLGWDGCELGLWHLSQHVLDEANPAGYFPYQTGVELKVWLYRR